MFTVYVCNKNYAENASQFLSLFLGAIVKVLKLITTAPDLNEEQQQNLDDILKLHASIYLIHRRPSTSDGLSAFFEHLKEVYNVSVKSVQKGSLIITVQCPTLKSLERLWSDYQSGCLNDIAERFLVTDELKGKLGLDNIRLKITIEKENYLICKKAFMENPGELGNLDGAVIGNRSFGFIYTRFGQG